MDTTSMDKPISEPDRSIGRDMTVLLDTIVQPTAAFRIIKDRPRWLVALVALSLLVVIGTFLGGPAQHNADLAFLQKQFTTTSDYAGFSQAGRDALVADTAHPPFWRTLLSGVVPMVMGLLTALAAAFVLWLVSRFLAHSAPFKTFFAAMMHVAIVSTALSAICAGVVTLIVGASQYTTYDQLDRAMPSLALLAPNAKDWVAAALGAVTPFAIWTAALQGLALWVIAATTRKQAVVVAGVLFVLGVCAQIGLSYL
jgi:hypothetical protein